MITKNHLRSHTLIFLANTIVGITYLLAKEVIPKNIAAESFFFLRILGATILFWSIYIFRKEKIDKRDYLRIFFCGLLGVTISKLAFFKGLEHTSPIDSSIISTLTPVAILFFSYFLLKEKMGFLKILGIILGFGGTFLLIWFGNHESGGTSSIYGNLLTLLKVLSYGAYIVIAKPLMQKYHHITVISWVFFVALITSIPFSYSYVIHTDWTLITPFALFVILYVTVCSTFLVYLFNLYSLKHLPASIIGSYIYLQPVVTYIAIEIYESITHSPAYTEDLSVLKIVSCLMIFVGIFLVSKKKKTIKIK
ncbi:DMT family transporter [Aureivirga sp. CE67]|uniref:DMT family transporter n=1 Tax=Aureivirga sp. CE67 TaxID=1788983 RepID=UPI0018C955BB|nr:DMT family transporter [Aureivirga sp. CE67]